jgi:hypothetical protein
VLTIPRNIKSPWYGIQRFGSASKMIINIKEKTLMMMMMMMG